MTTQKMDKAWRAFQVARAARDTAQREWFNKIWRIEERDALDAAQLAYEKAWALYTDANEAYAEGE